MNVRHQKRARRPSAPTDVQTEMSEDKGSEMVGPARASPSQTTAALVLTYRGTSFLPEDRSFPPLVLSLLRGTEGSNPSPSSGESGANRKLARRNFPWLRRSRPRRHPPQGDRGFESTSLQQRVASPPRLSPLIRPCADYFSPSHLNEAATASLQRGARLVACHLPHRLIRHCATTSAPNQRSPELGFDPMRRISIAAMSRWYSALGARKGMGRRSLP